MTSLQERLFAMQDKQYAAFQAKLTPGVPMESFMTLDSAYSSILRSFSRFTDFCPLSSQNERRHGVFETGATAPKKSEKDIETNRMCALANTAWANFAK